MPALLSCPYILKHRLQPLVPNAQVHAALEDVTLELTQQSQAKAGLELQFSEKSARLATMEGRPPSSTAQDCMLALL